MDLMGQLGTFLIGQLKSIPPEDPRLTEPGGQGVAIIIGMIFWVGILVVTFRQSKRDRVQSD
jgi:hypothetical protein